MSFKYEIWFLSSTKICCTRDNKLSFLSESLFISAAVCLKWDKTPLCVCVPAKMVPNSPTLDPLLAGLVSAFIIAAVVVILLLFLKLRKRGNQPEFRRLQDLPMVRASQLSPLLSAQFSLLGCAQPKPVCKIDGTRYKDNLLSVLPFDGGVTVGNWDHIRPSWFSKPLKIACQNFFRPVNNRGGVFPTWRKSCSYVRKGNSSNVTQIYSVKATKTDTTRMPNRFQDWRTIVKFKRIHIQMKKTFSF